ncbi:MAG: radical SAM protein, partial [Muribaculaceae bacterium]
IVEEVKMLVSRGVKEFNVIAQDLSSYGLDLYGKMMLPELIETIAHIPGVEWIRLHYAYPAQFPYELLRVIRDNNNVCKYLDIALQHISNNVLSNMRRHITKDETLKLIETIRKEVPGIHIRTTLMVGFPGEGDNEFEELKEFVSTIKFDRMGAFAYSEEDDTYAAKNLEDVISAEVKESRLSEIMDIQEQIALRLNEAKVGKAFRVIIDREDNDYYIARTEFDSPEVDPEVLINKTETMEIGTFYNVKITEALPFELIANIINDK